MLYYCTQPQHSKLNDTGWSRVGWNGCRDKPRQDSSQTSSPWERFHRHCPDRCPPHPSRNTMDISSMAQLECETAYDGNLWWQQFNKASCEGYTKRELTFLIILFQHSLSDQYVILWIPRETSHTILGAVVQYVSREHTALKLFYPIIKRAKEGGVFSTWHRGHLALCVRLIVWI